MMFGTWILDGVRTSKEADALKEKVAKGLEIVVEFFIVKFWESTSWEILFTFNSGTVPMARRGNNSENAVYLKT